MNKSELVAVVKEELGLSNRKANQAVDVVFDTIAEKVGAGEKVVLAGFGTFSKNTRAARAGRNPQTGESITIAEKSVPKFTAGKKFKEACL